MPSKKCLHPLIQYWHTERFLILLVSLLLMLVLSPFLQHFRWFEIFRNILMTWIFLAIFNTTTWRNKQLVYSFLLVIFAIAALWAPTLFGPGVSIFAISSILIGIYLLFSIIVLAAFIFGAVRVGREVIYVSIIIYLLISIIWAYFFATLEAFVPGSFSMPFDTSQSDKFFWHLYFSQITITTLGYGDITPLNTKAAALASTEAVIGQIYLVVIVAWLVGTHVSQRSGK
jgi:hypothetical protein